MKEKKYRIISGGVTAPKGFKASGAATGLKPNNQLDIALIESDVEAVPAIVTTQNAVKAAPVLWDNQIVKKDKQKIKAVLVNSGNANACTGEQGLLDVKTEAECVSQHFNCDPNQVFISSTGVIGVPLPIKEITDTVPTLVQNLSIDGQSDASRAILTTDLVPKTVAVEIEIGGKTVHIGAMAKGSGMICPNMATMLSFVTTDADIDQACLQKMLSVIAMDTYNMMSVDGDMSTNDTVLVLANGMAGNEKITEANIDAYTKFFDALYFVNASIVKSIVKDGEGATKYIEVHVNNADSRGDARILAKAVVNSNLVKTAIFGEDANWGRVLSSIGATGVKFSPNTVSLTFSNSVGSILLLDHGKPTSFDEKQASDILKQKEIIINIDMGEGIYKATAWGCDLSYDYVKINAEYRT
ncbi:bifunctional ornithine acetyltransferase/N-acetylglutamate synthase [uncultured Pseudoramibacter sp.]|uniref:Arginine biosynthesis bifunctional protein ArgJ n=1 Tax=Candidatus Pseudoramibacter fermentans TaxID=2594427 RepID=A0A6L5GRV1_9FIRM|nr:bifunctional ornithine acetyltransferase/N-acetylglutamate synthase [uncultured Pseudoramibacter sp.]MQM72858.1 bifunctional ornithine acetyltransferase/N-acetylglutamate synthase [Candidatus Pseudoramibacter fermentans]RRF93790.1 MAG: bifunctional ornithine acetyltransferase/N-acetylglutamate synthase [Eubacteriaceae bacterium]